MMRIGFGEDIHLFVEGRKLMLGGVEVPYEKGLLGHSDADALLHAVTDALLGACRLGDIGRLYPPDDPKTEGIDSKKILAHVVELVREKGYRIINVDSNIVTESPKLKLHIPAIELSLARLLQIDEDCVSVKAKTNEGCDAVGEKKALRANAIVLLEKGENS